MDQDVTQPDQPPENNQPAQELDAEQWAPAGFWLRLFAFLYDSILVTILTTISSGLIVLLLSLILAPTLKLTTSGDLDSYEAFANALAELPFLALIPFVMLFILLLFITLAVPYLYFALFERSRYMTTPGKAIFRLAVTDLEGRPISFWIALKRNLLKSIGPLLMFVGGALGTAILIEGQYRFIGFLLLGVSLISGLLVIFVGYLMAAFTEDKQALHDHFARCLVLKRLDFSFPRRVFFAIVGVIAYLLFQYAFNHFSESSEKSRTDYLLEKLTGTDSKLPDSIDQHDTQTNEPLLISPRKTKRSSTQRESTETTRIARGDTTELPPSLPRIGESLKDTPEKPGSRPYPTQIEPTILPANIKNSTARLLKDSFTFDDAYGKLSPDRRRIEIALLSKPVGEDDRNRLLRTLRFSNMLPADYESLSLALIFAIQFKPGSEGCTINDIEYYEVYFPTVGTALENKIRQRHVLMRRGISSSQENVLNNFTCERKLNGSLQLLTSGAFTVAVDQQKIPLSWNLNLGLKLY